MATKPDTAAKHSAVKARKGSYDTVLIIRLVFASVVFAASMFMGFLPSFLVVIMRIIAAIVAGYDVILDALSCITERDFFATPVVVVFITFLSYIIGFSVEGAALVLLYQIGMMLIFYIEEKSKLSALELLQYQDEATVNEVTGYVFRDGAGWMNIESSMRYSAGSILKLAMVFSVVYAIALPIITSYSFIVSIHRALMILLIATPMSIVISMPVTGITAMCFSARHGVIFENAAVMEAVAEADIAVFDSAGIFTDSEPRLTELDSEILDYDTFLTFIAHAVYFSSMPLKKTVSAAYRKEYQPELISNFSEIPGYGVELDIGSAHVILAARELFAGRGIKLPPDRNQPGQYYYMTVGGRYVGRLTVFSDLNREAEELVVGMRQAGVRRCILVSEQGNMESRRIAEEMDFREVFGECDQEKKLLLVQELKSASNKPVVYIYSDSISTHSTADVDIRVGRKKSHANALISPEFLANLPFSVQICKRMREIAMENAIFAFVVKALLIFLSMVGYCNLWFAIFIDMAAAMATILNSIRVTQDSIINILLYKTGKK